MFVFWPLDIPYRSGAIWGYTTSKNSICVIDIIDDTQADRLRKGKAKASEHDEEPVGARVLGRLEVDVDGRKRVEIQSESGKSHQSSRDLKLITYTPPNPHRLRYLSVQPINLNPTPPSPSHLRQSELAYIKLDDLDLGSVRLEEDEAYMLDRTADCVNSVWQARRDGEGIDAGEGDRKGRQASSVQPPLGNSTSDSGLLGWIHHLSATARQLRLRYRQITSIPAEWRRTKRREGEKRSLRDVSLDYIRFYNTLWLLINDLIIGITISRVLEQQKHAISRWLADGLNVWAIDAVKHSLRWLDDWPVGLKLNTPLSNTFCSFFTTLTDIWASGLNSNANLIPLALTVLSLGSWLGIGMGFSILIDLTSLATLHLKAASGIMSRVYRWELSALYSLWNVFRGKRWNTLRLRVDSYDYEVDQLFLGTLLFTVTLFLFPTVLVYHLFFAVVNLFLTAANFAVETSLAFINAFPLFALMLRLKEPSRLPGGITIELCNERETASSGAANTHLELKNVPLSLGAIFSGFGMAWGELSVRYSPVRLLAHLALGK